LADKTGVELREVFLQRFTLQAHLHQLAEAFRSIN